MAILGFELDEIVRLIQMLEQSDLDQLVIKDESRFLRIRGPRVVSSPGSTLISASPVSDPVRHQRALLPPAPRAQETPVAAEKTIALTSPMMGMYYRADKPGAAPLINVGQHVSVGQAIGIIEAMKIFSEVLAEHSGTVVSVHAKDGELVQAGATLVILRHD